MNNYQDRTLFAEDDNNNPKFKTPEEVLAHANTLANTGIPNPEPAKPVPSTPKYGVSEEEKQYLLKKREMYYYYKYCDFGSVIITFKVTLNAWDMQSPTTSFPYPEGSQFDILSTYTRNGLIYLVALPQKVYGTSNTNLQPVLVSTSLEKYWKMEYRKI